MIDPKKGDAYQGHKKTNPARKARLHPGRSSPAKQLGIPQKLRIPKNFLVGGLEPWNFMTFHSVGNIIIPIDFNIFQRGRLNHQPVKLVAILKSRPAARKARPKCSAVKVNWRHSAVKVVWREPGGATIRVSQPHDR